MRISFDLDDTLICYAPHVPHEASRVPWWWKLISPGSDEPLRLGAPCLLRELSSLGHEVWIYTTSLRDERAVRRWLRFYGVRAVRVVNHATHNREARHGRGASCSKFPPAFGIELHVDDEQGLADVGARMGFRVLVVAADDQAWADKVRASVRSLAEELGTSCGASCGAS